MVSGVLRALEFDRVVEAVRGFALTPMGEARLAQLTPSPDAGAVARALAVTTEAACFVGKLGTFPLRASEALPDTLASLRVPQVALEPARLLALASFFESVWLTRLSIVRSAASYPLLDAASTSVASFTREVTDVRAAIDASGDVVDDASPALRNIRDRLRRQRTRLRGTLEAYLRDRDSSKYLQDQVVTERNGRYVIVVKAEHRINVPGLVHGTSASGASLYLEPLNTVDINNDIVALQEQEAEEVHRILLALTDAFRAREDDVQASVEAATSLDEIQARARFSELVDGVEPILSPDGTVELLGARHPLLMPQVLERITPESDGLARAARGSSAGPVPVTIRLLPPASVLLITGPNTGGKTVALKTVGLLALMAQAGLRIPAAQGSRLPVFRSVFADIGDEQSIEASLSTFSAHITNIASMDRRLDIPALVLLDEVGSGTDPIEGGALGVAIIDHLRRRGATVVATSHYDALKTYASTTEGVTCAAFGFHADTFAPTYQLVYGTPGRSLALEIAARLGLPPAIIAAARQNVSTRDAQLAEHLARVDRDVRALEHEQRLVARERIELNAAQLRLQQREDALRQREESSRKRLNDALESEVRQARREIDEVIAGLKQRTERIAQGAGRLVPTGETGGARSDARAALDAVMTRHVEPVATGAVLPAAPARPPAVGDRVTVGALGLEGTVTAVQGGRVEVDVRGKRMTSPVRDVRVVGGPVAQPRVDVHVELQPRETSLLDLNVIGCTVDEAITRTERFLDESLLADHRSFRLIHGHGTGQLRRGLTAFLRQHPLVAHLQPAPPEQGGGGVTLVELKD
ncbi:MAG: endonuclease MutS2 [Vicinamibacterales bacterium]